MRAHGALHAISLMQVTIRKKERKKKKRKKKKRKIEANKKHFAIGHDFILAPNGPLVNL